MVDLKLHVVEASRSNLRFACKVVKYMYDKNRPARTPKQRVRNLNMHVRDPYFQWAYPREVTWFLGSGMTSDCALFSITYKRKTGQLTSKNEKGQVSLLETMKLRYQGLS